MKTALVIIIVALAMGYVASQAMMAGLSTLAKATAILP